MTLYITVNSNPAIILRRYSKLIANIFPELLNQYFLIFS